MEPPTERWVTCTCRNCSGLIHFEASNAGDQVKCPLCGMDTVLFVPATPHPTEQNDLIFITPKFLILALIAVLAGPFVYLVINYRHTRQKENEGVQRTQTETNVTISANQTESAPPQAPIIQQPTKQPVTGAFGFTLGDKIENYRFPVEIRDGKPTITLNKLDYPSMAPFSSLSVEGTVNEHIVYSIHASLILDNVNGDIQKHALVSSLQEKYKELHHHRFQSYGETYAFGDNTNTVTLFLYGINRTVLSATYEIREIAVKEASDSRARHLQNAKATFKGL